MRRRACLAVVLGALACALSLGPAAEPAPAADFMLSVMQDDDNLIYKGHDQRAGTLGRMKLLGVDAVRVTLLWEAVAPRRRPRNGADPRAYPSGNWDRYDELVRLAGSHGIAVFFNVTPPGPRWAHARSPDRASRRTWKPSAREFGRFVQAAGRRYSGTYVDENGPGAALPRVSWWSIGNEPNQGGWLTPQAVRRGRAVVPYSPGLYRRLLTAGAAALLRSGHRNDLLLFGETAPLGSDPRAERRPLRPALFLRELFCLDRATRRYRGARARARGCGDVRALRVLLEFPRLAYGHHPYTKDLPPQRRHRHRDSITMANARALSALLDRIARRTGLIPKELPLLMTEFGYETNPPDPLNGISEQRQAAYLNESEYIAYANPRIFATTQFLLDDAAPQARFRVNSREYWFTYQSGLYTQTGKAKPAAFAYILPFEIRRISGNRRLMWGQVRFAANGARHTVYLQRMDAGSSEWRTDGPAITVTSHVGFFTAERDAPPGTTWRAVWVAPDISSFQVSREIVVR